MRQMELKRIGQALGRNTKEGVALGRLGNVRVAKQSSPGDIRSTQRQIDVLGGGVDSRGFDNPHGISPSQADNRGGGAKSKGYDNPKGISPSQISGAIRGSSTKWGKGKHGKANLGKLKGKHMGKGTSLKQKRINDKNNPANNEKNNKKRKDKSPVNCLCERPSCDVSYDYASASAMFRSYYSGAVKNQKTGQYGLDCAAIVRKKYPDHKYLQEKNKKKKLRTKK